MNNTTNGSETNIGTLFEAADSLKRARDAETANSMPENNATNGTIKENNLNGNDATTTTTEHDEEHVAKRMKANETIDIVTLSSLVNNKPDLNINNNKRSASPVHTMTQPPSVSSRVPSPVKLSSEPTIATPVHNDAIKNPPPVPNKPETSQAGTTLPTPLTNTTATVTPAADITAVPSNKVVSPTGVNPPITSSPSPDKTRIPINELSADTAVEAKTAAPTTTTSSTTNPNIATNTSGPKSPEVAAPILSIEQSSTNPDMNTVNDKFSTTLASTAEASLPSSQPASESNVNATKPTTNAAASVPTPTTTPTPSATSAPSAPSQSIANSASTVADDASPKIEMVNEKISYELKIEVVNSSLPVESQQKTTVSPSATMTTGMKSVIQENEYQTASASLDMSMEDESMASRSFSNLPDDSVMSIAADESNFSQILNDSNDDWNASICLDPYDPLTKVQLKYCQTILKALKRLKDIPPFLKPVDPITLNIPAYFDVIKHPMDISTVQKKLDDDMYPTVKHFESDVSLIFANCITFNGPTSFVSIMAQNVEKSFKKLISKMPAELPADKKKRKSLEPKPRSNSVDLNRPKREVPVTFNQPLIAMSPPKKKSKKVHHEIKFSNQILKELMNKKHLALNFPFLAPVDPIALGIPHYLEIIKHPMDLSTVKKKLDSSVYSDFQEFEKDVRLMLQNCFTFNHPGDEVYEIGKKFEKLFDSMIKNKPAAPSTPVAASSAPFPTPSQPKSSKPPKPPKASTPAVPIPVPAPQPPPLEESSDDEYNNQQIELLQQNLKLMSSQLAMLMEKKKRKKEKRKSLSVAAEPAAKPRKPRARKKKLKTDMDSLPEMSFDQKRELSEKINALPPEKVVDVFQIIREGMPSIGDKANEEEIELDINSLDKKTIYRLYEFVKKNAPKNVPKPVAPVQRKMSSSGSSSSDSGSDTD